MNRPPVDEGQLASLEQRMATCEARLAEHEREQTRHFARLVRLLDEGIGTFLNAKFPFGRPTDRWRRRG